MRRIPGESAALTELSSSEKRDLERSTRLTGILDTSSARQYGSINVMLESRLTYVAAGSNGSGVACGSSPLLDSMHHTSVEKAARQTPIADMANVFATRY
mgnify:CR=1 FL=1